MTLLTCSSKSERCTRFSVLPRDAYA